MKANAEAEAERRKATAEILQKLEVGVESGVEEMVEWPRGNLENYSENVPSRKTGWAKQIHTSVYKSDGFNVGVLAPG
ncbi:MAG: hypothetical protein CFH10_02357, partial [Alphaproteobacteria bacterium MarineAlpha4_Bin2]